MFGCNSYKSRMMNEWNNISKIIRIFGLILFGVIVFLGLFSGLKEYAFATETEVFVTQFNGASGLPFGNTQNGNVAYTMALRQNVSSTDITDDFDTTKVQIYWNSTEVAGNTIINIWNKAFSSIIASGTITNSTLSGDVSTSTINLNTCVPNSDDVWIEATTDTPNDSVFNRILANSALSLDNRKNGNAVWVADSYTLDFGFYNSGGIGECGSGSTPPTLTSISPTSTSAGSELTYITLTGTGFTSTSTIYWNKLGATSTLPLWTFTSSSSIITYATSSTLNSISTSTISITNSDGESNGIIFYVIAPIPTIEIIYPIASSTNPLASFTDKVAIWTETLDNQNLFDPTNGDYVAPFNSDTTQGQTYNFNFTYNYSIILDNVDTVPVEFLGKEKYSLIFEITVNGSGVGTVAAADSVTIENVIPPPLYYPVGQTTILSGSGTTFYP